MADRMQRNIYLHLLAYDVIKDVMNDADKQPDEEIRRERSRGGPECRNFCPHGVGVQYPPST